jgi:hypothetical protein
MSWTRSCTAEHPGDASGADCGAPVYAAVYTALWLCGRRYDAVKQHPTHPTRLLEWNPSTTRPTAHWPCRTRPAPTAPAVGGACSLRPTKGGSHGRRRGWGRPRGEIRFNVIASKRTSFASASWDFPVSKTKAALSRVTKKIKESRRVVP